MNPYAYSFAYPSVCLLHTLLLDAFGRTTLLLLAAWTVTRLFRRMSAAQQHFLWLSALVGVAYVLAVSLVLPVGKALKLPADPAAAPVIVWRYATPKLETVTPQAYQQFTQFADGPTLLISPLTSAVVAHSTGLEWSLQGISWLAVGWLFGFVTMLLRFARNQRAVQILRWHSQPFENAIVQEILVQVATRLGIARLPVLLILKSEGGAFSPLTWGWKHTFLLLPADVETWQAERIEAIILHELAHIKRGDWLMQRIADAICALLWFHPLVWLAVKNLRNCAERACDDIALTHGIAPDRYAQHLLDIVQTLRPRPLAPAMTLPFLRGSQFEPRLCAILDHTRSRGAFSRTWQCGILAAGALGLMPFALALPVTTQPVKYIVTDPATAAGSKFTLSDGITLELRGVTSSDKNRKTKTAVWWKPNGTLLAAPLYAQTVADQNFNRNKSSLLDHILTFSFKVSGLTDANARLTQALVKNSLMTGNSINTSVPQSKTDFVYEVHVAFTKKRPDTTSLRLKIARGQWQTEAQAADLPSTAHVSDALTVTFGKPSKEEAGIATRRKESGTGKRGNGSKPSELAVIIRFEESKTEDDADRRVVVVDDQGKTIPLGGSDALVYESNQTGKPEIHLLVTVPETLRGHIRQYQLQTRPYQYVDFPNVALKPNTP